MQKPCCLRAIHWVLLVPVALASVSCGYRLAGQGRRLPAHVHVIAIPALENHTPWMRLEQRLTGAVMEEFIHRTRYRIVGSQEGADAVLRGTVKTVTTTPVIFDPATGRASAVQVAVTVAVEFRDLHNQQVLYANPDYLFREQYEISIVRVGVEHLSDLDSFFEERDPAVERLARDFATSLVSAILENF